MFQHWIGKILCPLKYIYWTIQTTETSLNIKILSKNVVSAKNKCPFYIKKKNKKNKQTNVYLLLSTFFPPFILSPDVKRKVCVYKLSVSLFLTFFLNFWIFCFWNSKLFFYSCFFFSSLFITYQIYFSFIMITVVSVYIFLRVCVIVFISFSIYFIHYFFLI